jgi:hypothetical protein
MYVYKTKLNTSVKDKEVLRSYIIDTLVDGSNRSHEKTDMKKQTNKVFLWETLSRELSVGNPVS